MTIHGPPPAYYYEDRTGLVAGSDFDEAYDRSFLRVSATPQRTHGAALMVYHMGQRSTIHGERDQKHYYREPAVTLEFGPKGTLGTLHFSKNAQSVPMHQYLRRVSLFSGSLHRKFRAQDGHEYRWAFRVADSQEWTCVNEEGYLVAHYTLKPSTRHAYGTSGNVFTVLEPFTTLSAELLASLTVMRHIAEHNL